jgi:proteasome assembly chaperone (PAC2) family protein
MATDALRVTEEPTLRDPVLIMAFAGWNDAAESATAAVRYLIRSWSAKKFADIDPEEFYDFTETRPTVRINRSMKRRIDWPANEFYYRINTRGPRDYVLMVGVEPNLRWRAFCSTLLDFIRRLGVGQVILLGGLVADIPHTRPVPVTATASDGDAARKLEELNTRGSRYEGPTGIVGVLSDTLRAEGFSCASLWATVPHYISTSNPKATHALLSRLQSLLDLDAPLSELEQEAEEFERQVAKAVERDPEVAAYVRQLEERTEDDDEEFAEHPELPPGETVIRELEDFLRRSRGDSSGPSSHSEQ